MSQKHPRVFRMGFYVVAAVVLAVLFVLSLQLGTFGLGPSEIFQIIGNPDDERYFSLVEYRLPRAVLAVLLGGALAVSGVLVQSVIRNPLASPDILGISHAAGLVAVACLIFMPDMDFHWLPVFAFIGGLLSFVILRLVCGIHFKPVKMAVVGVALSALWEAVSQYLMLANPVEINTAMLWLTGSLWGRSWDYLAVAVPWLLVLLPVPFFFARDLDVMGLGERKAATLGVPVDRIQLLILVFAVALATTAVAVSGPIAFLGLVCPHLARKLVGGRHSVLLPAAVLLGAVLLTLADILARVIDPPTELPAGIFTALVGARYFFYLLMRTR